VKKNNGTDGSNGSQGICFWNQGPCFFRNVLIGRILTTPPVVWKTTEEDGNPPDVASLSACFVLFSAAC
jgi:hypothetical protein